MSKTPVLLYKILVLDIILLFIGMSVVSSAIRISNHDDITPPVATHNNDFFNKLITFDDFHDVGIKKITSPSNPFNKFKSFSLTFPEVYIQPGTESIDVIVENNGTFPEFDLTCYAEIYEYITDPENGTLVYEDEITDIDLEEPNGGTKLINFDDFTFAYEGIYCLFLDLPLEIDYYPDNNHKELIIGVDDTNPDCDFPPILNPVDPTGENGWYVDDVTVTLDAHDPWSNYVSSGVKEIRYTINDGAEHVIDGSTGSFVLTEEGNDILVKYWAVDYVGNVESTKNSFEIDIDQTPPQTDLTYEIVGGNWLIGWDFEYTFIVFDFASGVNATYYRIEGGEWEIYTGPFTIRWNGEDILIEYYSVDYAGNVEDIKSSNVTINSNIYPFEILKLPNNYTGYIGRFFIFATFNTG